MENFWKTLQSFSVRWNPIISTPSDLRGTVIFDRLPVFVGDLELGLIMELVPYSML